MPHLNLQISPLGPVIDVAVSVSNPRADALRTAGKPVPNPFQIRALVDTGASCTCIDPNVLSALGLSPTGSSPVHTPSTGGVAINIDQYDVGLILFTQTLSLTIGSLAVIATKLEIQGIQALIGRDVLKQCLLIYDGQLGVFTLAI